MLSEFQEGLPSARLGEIETDTVSMAMGSLKTTWKDVATATLIAVEPGVTLMTCGGVVSDEPPPPSPPVLDPPSVPNPPPVPASGPPGLPHAKRQVVTVARTRCFNMTRVLPDCARQVEQRGRRRRAPLPEAARILPGKRVGGTGR